METKTISFRNMTIDDVEDIMVIEHACFTVPWTKNAFVGELTKNSAAQYTVIEYDGTIVGYCGMWLILDQASITNVAVLPDFRGKGLGEAIMDETMKLAFEQGVNVMSLEVRVSNTVAQSLYRKLGFQDGGIRKRYYSDNNEDALVMWVNI